MIKTIDRETCRLLRDRIEQALAPLGQELGIKFNAGNASFNPSNVTFKLEAAITNADGSVETKEATDFKQLASLYGLKADDYGKPFSTFNGTYNICGLARKSHKFPILAKNAKGKVYKFAVEQVKLGLEKAKA